MSGFMRSSLLCLSLSAALFTTSCSSQKAGPKPGSHDLQETMNRFRAELLDLAPYLYSSARYQNPDNQQEILSHLSDLRAEVRSVNHTKTAALKQDPSMAFAMKEMSDLLDQGLRSFKEGKKDFSRSQVKKSLGQCFYCHTRGDDGSQWIGGESLANDVAWSSPLDQANFLVALRDFGSARKVLLDALKTHKIQAPLDKEIATRKLMAITVRSSKDTKAIMDTVKELSSIKNLPPSLRASLPAWRKDIQSWPATPKSSEARLDLAESLIEQDRQRRDGELDGDILLLRASKILHSQLEEHPDADSEERARALYLLGQCYERLVDLGFWELNENYYEACIAETPHSMQARQCFDAWDQSITVGYSGSSGTHIPAAVAKKRAELLKLADPK